MKPLTREQIDDVRREIVVMREMGDHPRADYWEMRLAEEIERAESYIPPPPISKTPSAGRAFDRAERGCSVAGCNERRETGSRWCDAHRPRFEEVAA